MYRACKFWYCSCNQPPVAEPSSYVKGVKSTKLQAGIGVNGVPKPGISQHLIAYSKNLERNRPQVCKCEPLLGMAKSWLKHTAVRNNLHSLGALQIPAFEDRGDYFALENLINIVQGILCFSRWWGHRCKQYNLALYSWWTWRWLL